MASHTISIAPVTIDAPAETVWRAMTDFSAYPQWNPFSVKAESSLVIGEPVVLHIARGSSGKLMRQAFVLETLEPPHRIAWRLPKMGHKLLFNAYREQVITPLSSTQCSYCTSDTFNGLMAGKIYRAQAAWVEQNFNKMAAALKAYCEPQAHS